MSPAPENDSLPRCLQCGHVFDPPEIAAMQARANRDDLCIVVCTECGARNEVRSEPQGGLDEQPALVVRRIVDEAVPAPSVFGKTVD